MSDKKMMYGVGQLKEMSTAISTLKRFGFNISLPREVAKHVAEFELFRGDDGLFKSILPSVKTYFEYGCGKSTEYVYKYSDAVIRSVDTSEKWASATQALSEGDSSQRLNVHWVDVGDVSEWGMPMSYAKRANFQDYTDWFWRLGLEPDLVVVDGRFRVCSFLTSVKYAPVGTKILFDDYMERPGFQIAEEFLDVVERCGKQ